MRLRFGPFLLMLAAMVLSPGITSIEAKGIPVRFRGELECLEQGGATFHLTVRNPGTKPLDIKNDFHVTTERIRAKARRVLVVLFVFPAPTHEVIPPGEERTFLLGIGDGIDDAEPMDLRAKSIRIETEFWFENHGHVYRRYMSFPGCNKVTAP